MGLRGGIPKTSIYYISQASELQTWVAADADFAPGWRVYVVSVQQVTNR